MKDFLTQLRHQYFTKIASRVKPFEGQFIILTHLLSDRPELLNAINQIAPIALIIAIPYSLHQETLTKLKQYPIITPKLTELYNATYLNSLLAQVLPKAKTMLLEIGGYFANVLPKLDPNLAKQLIGVVEDTEIGHRAYETNAPSLSYPVISIARSMLKTNEDFLVGPSCLYSTEKLFRRSGFLIDNKCSLVLGYGKVGQGLARALAKRNDHTMVYDTKAQLRITALSEGFQIPERDYALAHADIIYGTTGVCSVTGADFKQLKNGVFLVSCSSKNVEFDIATLESTYTKTKLLDYLDRYEKDGQSIYLAAAGTPINFIDEATIGPILALTQGEIIAAIQDIITLHNQNQSGLFATAEHTKLALANTWLECFSTTEGKYRHV